MGTQRVQMRGGVLPWLILWACHAGTRDFCAALAALQNIFPYRSLFQFPIVQQAGQPAMLGRLSLS